MPNRPLNFKWQESSPYLDLLEKFTKPRDVNQVVTWQFVRQTIGEDTEFAIDRFIRDGALIPSTIEETLECIFQVAQLKKLLQERNLKLSGSKSELVERLVLSDRSGMEKIARKGRVMKCSATALELLSEHEQKKQLALDSAKKQSFNALKSNDPKNAYKIYANYQKAYVTPAFESNSYQVEELMNILKSQPKILSAVSRENLMLLKAIAGMQLLWRDEALESLSSSNSLSGLKNDRIAINYILAHTRITESIERHKEYAKQVKIEFDSGDIDSCELCQALNGKVFDIDKVPELPMIGCTSDTGCKCHIDSIFDDSDDNGLSFKIQFDGDDSDEENDEESDSLSKLRQLKQMLDEKLITEVEYEEKKAEILSRF
ncbi:MAG: hypothetical protein HDKAJFGB_03645 [Anaerolineae bacterium]|nr:hypothetical protein [Anaerolineae bacterium]RIK34340.1 MAG: hypothetical protein DCC52_00935 [Chloroflexota bacterium]